MGFTNQIILKKGMTNMKKRLLSTFLTICMAVCSLFVLAGCKSDVNNFSMAGVKDNGGIGAIKGNYYYYMVGATADRKLTKDNWGRTGIYKVLLDENGNIAGEPEVVINTLCGYKEGSIAIFGDYIYFVTPSQQSSSSASILTDRTSFCRVKTDGTGYKVIYSTETSSTLTYAYYHVSDEDLFIACKEGSKLYTINVSSKNPKPIVISENVSSAVFADNNGIGENANKYIFYTEEPAKNFVTQLGHNVYKVEPGKTEGELLSSGKDISLVGVKVDYLYYQIGEVMYRTKAVGGLSSNEVVTYAKYDKYLLLNDGGMVFIDSTAGETWYINWNGGTMEKRCLIGSTNYSLLAVTNGTLYTKYTDNKIYKVSLSETRQTPKAVTSDTIEELADNLKCKVVGDKICYFVKEVVTSDDGKETTWYNLKWADIN